MVAALRPRCVCQYSFLATAIEMLKSHTSLKQILWSATIPLPEMWWSRNSNSESNGTRREENIVMGKSGNSKTASVDSRKLRLDHSLAQAGVSPRSRPRIALYSHDTMGLGHLRRNLLIAQALTESEIEATALLITGAHETNFFSLPMGTDCLTLPRFQKDCNGKYIAGHLGISVNDLVRLRAESICSAMRVFQPDVFIVDKVPTGAFGELLPALRFMKGQLNTKCVLGMRDILDAPETVLAEWEASESHEAIAEFFDEVWVYGDSQVYDPALEYGWPAENVEKIRFTGYLNQSTRLESQSTRLEKMAEQEMTPIDKEMTPIDKLRTESDQLVVCTLGGGQDGHSLARAFVDGFPESGFQGVLLTGPFMPSKLLSLLQELAENRPNLHVIKFAAEADQLISRADRVIAMGGYNTVCSLLSFQKKSLLVPRVYPRSEQWIRAQRLQQLGFVDVLHPDDLSPAAINRWVINDSSQPPKATDVIDLNGLPRIQELCRTLIGKKSQHQPRPTGKLV